MLSRKFLYTNLSAFPSILMKNTMLGKSHFSSILNEMEEVRMNGAIIFVLSANSDSTSLCRL